jgi:plasmid maintenance system killer protein
MLEINYKPSFVKTIGDLEISLQEEIIEKIELFRDPRNHRQLKVHKLNGPLKKCYSFSVNYKYRVIFEYLSKKEAVLFDVGDHDIYANI